MCSSDLAQAPLIAYYNGKEAVARMLERGTDVNAVANDGTSALWIACQEGEEAVARCSYGYYLNLGSCSVLYIPWMGQPSLKEKRVCQWGSV